MRMNAPESASTNSSFVIAPESSVSNSRHAKYTCSLCFLFTLNCARQTTNSYSDMWPSPLTSKSATSRGRKTFERSMSKNCANSRASTLRVVPYKAMSGWSS